MSTSLSATALAICKLRLQYGVEVKNQIHRVNFSHRITCTDGRVGKWVGYTSISVLDGYCSVTPFFIGSSKCVRVLSAQDFMLAMEGKKL